MWIHRSEVLAPLTSMTSKQAKWNWDDKCQQAFDTIKKLVARKTLLSYPNTSLLNDRCHIVCLDLYND